MIVTTNSLRFFSSHFPVDFQVGWFNTTVNGYEGTRVTVPNRRILDGTVIDKTNKRFRVCQKYLVSWLFNVGGTIEVSLIITTWGYLPGLRN